MGGAALCCGLDGRRPGCAQLARLFQVAEAHQAVVLLVVEAEFQRVHAGAQGDGFDVEQVVLGVSLLQVVVGDARAEVVDVVKADVARKPLQDLGQFMTPLKKGRSNSRFLANWVH